MPYIIPFENISIKSINVAGGKVAALGEMIKNLKPKGIPVPSGFCISADAFRYFLAANKLTQFISDQVTQINVDDVAQLQKISRKIKRKIVNAAFPDDLLKKIDQAFKEIAKGKRIRVAVRSSATAEDLPTASFAGLHESFVHVTTKQQLLDAVKHVFASLYNERAIAYRRHNEFEESHCAMAVGVQFMVNSDNATSGVMFSLDPESGFDQVVLINATYGLGEGIVSGRINPDEFVIFKPNAVKKIDAVLQRKLGSKEQRMVFRQGKTTSVRVPLAQQHEFCLDDDQLAELARYAIIIDEYFQKPMDIEWAQDTETGQFYIVQARPETVKSQRDFNSLTVYSIDKPGKILCQGQSVGENIGQGAANVITDVSKMKKFNKGDVLVADITDPDWEPIMKHASAIVTNRGGRTCHAAIIARELGIPAVVGTGNATSVISSNTEVTVSCAEGETGYVFQGNIPYTEKTIALKKKIKKKPYKVSMNLGNPAKAFAYQFIPNDGVGLARIEFIISTMIGVHPSACLYALQLPKAIQQQITEKTYGYASPPEFYVAKLAEGMATIAAAFYPKEVIFRFSDFKSNEYANLIGGSAFEPKEENPMIGYRGASRYVFPDFEPCFGLECAAVKHVREKMKLTNAQVMIPFVRTVEEGASVVKLMKSFGLQRRKAGLKIYMMCEVPSNAIIPEAFLKHFDGFSIGSNDLTQLTLGIDRDSELIASEFDEKNPAVTNLLSKVIKLCRKENKYIGICGQGPSDDPKFADWLIKQGIGAISLTPDAVLHFHSRQK